MCGAGGLVCQCWHLVLCCWHVKVLKCAELVGWFVSADIWCGVVGVWRCWNVRSSWAGLSVLTSGVRWCLNTSGRLSRLRRWQSSRLLFAARSHLSCLRILSTSQPSSLIRAFVTSPRYTHRHIAYLYHSISVWCSYCWSWIVVGPAAATGSGFDVAWLSCLPSTSVFSVYLVLCRKKMITSFSLPFSVLSLWDWPLTWQTVILQCYYHCWLGHLTCKIVSEMTYNVLSGTLNPTIPYHTCQARCSTYLQPYPAGYVIIAALLGCWFVCWFRRYTNCLFAYLTSLLTFFLVYLLRPE